MGSSDALARLAADRTSGARAIAAGCRAVLREYALSARADLGAGEYMDGLGALAARIARLRPPMALLSRLASDLLAAVDRGAEAPAAELVARTLEALEAQERRAAEALDRIARAGAAALASAQTVLTVSRSGTVEAVLHRLASQRKLRVIVSEGRPGGEGTLLAIDLAGRGIEVELVLDAALPGRVRAAGAVLVGADAVSEAWFANKVGTYPVALAANLADVPLFVAVEESKFLSAGVPFAGEERDPAEILTGAPAGIRVSNAWFETTPLELVASFLTNEGILAPDNVQARCRALSPTSSGCSGTGGSDRSTNRT
ncbi:MAG: hypothetical protein HY720_16970 [Planctomycetes bacterium]|nr:hypothetical protein [Planctomycetota bacterium]